MPQIPLLTAVPPPCDTYLMRSVLSAREFARIVQKDKKTVIRWIQKHQIPGAKRVGRFYQIPIEQVEVYQNASEYPVPCQK